MLVPHFMIEICEVYLFWKYQTTFNSLGFKKHLIHNEKENE
jgi:hypothetical protein